MKALMNARCNNGIVVSIGGGGTVGLNSTISVVSPFSPCEAGKRPPPALVMSTRN